MARVRLSGRTAATAATANVAGAALWNPHASVRLRVYEFSWGKTVATADFIALARISARGTATSSLTAAQVNETDYAVAPPSGAILDLTYSGQPTLISTTSFMFRWPLPAAVGAGLIQSLPEELEIGPGQGLAVITPVATILQPADVGFAWAE